MTKFAFIPARKGSERIINKNKILLNGIPLIFYTFAQALSLFNPNAFTYPRMMKKSIAGQKN